MSRKNSKIKFLPNPRKSFEKKIVKEIGDTTFHEVLEGNVEPLFRTVGNYRLIENFIGIRLNTSDGITSEYYLVYEADVQKCFGDRLSVAYVYFLSNRHDAVGIKQGTCRQSVSGKALKVLLDSGRQIILNKSGIEKCLKNIYYIGSVLEFKKKEIEKS